MKTRFLSFVLGVCVLVSPARAEVVIGKATLETFGLFEENRSEPKGGSLTILGFIDGNRSQRLVKSTEVVPAKMGTTFGITYTISGSPSGAEIDVLIKLLHPPMKNPADGQISTVAQNPGQSTIDGPNYDGFTFDDPWEIIPGKWTFQVYTGERLLLEKSFEVVLPQAGE